MTFTKNLMAWLPVGSGDDTKILHLKPAGESYFRPYTAYRQLAQPDYKVQGGSKGYATMQYLKKRGWEFENSEVAVTQKFLVFASRRSKAHDDGINIDVSVPCRHERSTIGNV